MSSIQQGAKPVGRYPGLSSGIRGGRLAAHGLDQVWIFLNEHFQIETEGSHLFSRLLEAGPPRAPFAGMWWIHPGAGCLLSDLQARPSAHRVLTDLH